MAATETQQTERRLETAAASEAQTERAAGEGCCDNNDADSFEPVLFISFSLCKKIDSMRLAKCGQVEYQNNDEIHRRDLRSSVKMCFLSIRLHFSKKIFGDDEKMSYICGR